MDTLPASRRQLLTLAGLTLGVGAIELAAPAAPAAAAPADELVLQPVADEPVAVLSGDGAAPAALPRQLAVQVVRTIALPAGTRIAITFDPRVYAPLMPPVIFHEGRPVAADRTLVADPTTGQRTSTIVLTEAVPAAGTVVAVVGTAQPLRYPYDLIRRPSAPTARIRRSPHAAQSSRALRPRRPPAFGGPARPWAAELDAVWSPRSWGEDDRYRYHVPVRVTLRSVGPAPVPAGTSFAVSLDSRLVRAVAIASLRLNHKPYGKRIRRTGQSRTGSAHQTRWRLPVRLAPGDVLDVYLKVTTAVPAGPLAGATHPVVTLVPSENVAAQRRTGKESLTRVDSVTGDTASG